MNIYEQIVSNQRATWITVSLFVIFFLLLGFGFDYFYGEGLPVFSSVALLFGIISSVGSFLYGDKVILASTRARPLDLNDVSQRQWQNVVEEMSIASGIKVPQTYVIDDPDPNAFATGRDPEHASIAVTVGLLSTLNREELQAVAAHEMSHIKNFDIRLMLIIAVLLGSIALLADWAARMTFHRRRRSRDSEGAGALIILVIWLIAVILAPIISQIMAMFVSRRREYLADATGAELTRNPLALASALQKIEARVGPTRSIHQGNAHLCIADPKGAGIGLREGFTADLFATHPPIAKRIEILKQMAYSK
ncbi:MAG: M48 family metallopeptidase [Candidatus Omnitrophica bacterium]|nr:M48 family metallopeptidase [Candidatus Omnitrophota bacterium]